MTFAKLLIVLGFTSYHVQSILFFAHRFSSSNSPPRVELPDRGFSFSSLSAALDPAPYSWSGMQRVALVSCVAPIDRDTLNKGCAVHRDNGTGCCKRPKMPSNFML
jgi:hypothetical protein